MADIVRCAGQAFIERSRKWINWQHRKVLLAIVRCRTAALGGHRDRCTGCGHTTTISYNSCRNRHCPRCQGNARRRWLQARERELLPTRYVHAVFTLPRDLAPLVLQNKRLIYNLLFHASAETLLEVARDPRHLGAEIGFFSVLHSWNQRLQFHPHIHCVVAAGGLVSDHSGWIAISNSRLVALSDGNVTFRWRDSAHGNRKRLMTLAVDEFLRRFLLHLLPPGFVRIRNFGFLANRNRAALLPLCLRLLGGSQKNTAASAAPSTDRTHSLWNCPGCGGTMRVVERLSAAQLLLRSPPQPDRCAA
jgi:hypothetical protein